MASFQTQADVTMKLSIVLGVGPAETQSSITQRAALASLAAQDFPSAETELVVSQHDSSQGFREELGRLFPDAKVVDAPDHGYYRLKNLGIQQASGEIIALADPDCLYTSDWAASIVKAIDAGADVAIGFSYMEGSSRFRRICAYFDLQQMLFRVSGPVRRFNSHNVGFRAATIKSHLYDARFERTGGCVELAERLHAASVRTAFNPRQSAVHVYRGASRHTWQQAICEGYDFVHTRSLNPGLSFAGLMRLAWAAPPLVTATFLLTDAYTFLRYGKALRLQAVDLPAFALASVFMRTTQMLGMYWTLARPKATAAFVQKHFA